MLQKQWSFLTKSVLEWLIQERSVSPFLLQSSYRCQNPRLIRFSSTLFYNARVRTSESAEYFKLSFNERELKYPASTLRFFKTSNLPIGIRQERLILDGNRPGLENAIEAKIAQEIFEELLTRYTLKGITSSNSGVVK